MSAGGDDNPKDFERSLKRKSGGSMFSHAIAKVAVAQICESEGFQGFQQSALERLSDIAVRYIHSLGKISHTFANSAGRTECNVFDILQGLEDLGSAQGFPCASDVNHCVGSSGIVQEIIQYVNEAKEIPFAYSIPHFPVIRDKKLTSSFLLTGQEPPSEHIPSWLPTFPDPHTYLQSSVQNERTMDTCSDEIEQAKQHKNFESSLLVMQPQLASNGPEGRPLDVPGGTAGAKQGAESNPFLAAPLLFGEKVVRTMVLPTKLSEEAAAERHARGNHASLLDTFAPAIEAVKLGLPDSEDGQTTELLNQRPAVQFKVGIGRKSLGADMDLSLHNKGVKKVSHWLGKDNEKDDKKRRAEKILKESMENPQELNQL